MALILCSMWMGHRDRNWTANLITCAVKCRLPEARRRAPDAWVSVVGSRCPQPCHLQSPQKWFGNISNEICCPCHAYWCHGQKSFWLGVTTQLKTPLPLIGLSGFVSGWAMLLAPLSAESSRHKVMTACREPQSKRSIKHFSIPTCLDHLAGPKARALLLRLAMPVCATGMSRTRFPLPENPVH